MNMVRAFFPKSGHFFTNFEKRAGKTSLLFLPLVARLHIYVLMKKVIILKVIHVIMKSFPPSFSTKDRN